MTLPLIQPRQGGTGLTSLAALPISTAQQAALDLKADKSQLATSAMQRFSVADGNVTAGATTITVSAYTPGTVLVFSNGNKLPTTAYTATSGTTVVLTDPVQATDVIEVLSWLLSGVQNAAPISHQHSTSDLTGPALSQALGGTGATSLGAAAFLSTGSTIARAVADRAAEVANLLDFFQAGDTDWSAALTRAIATGKPVEIPFNGGTPYALSSTWSLPAGTVIRGKGKRPTLKLDGTSSRLFTVTAANVEIRDLIIDGSKVGLASQRVIQFDAGASDGICDGVDLLSPTQGFGIYNGATRCKILRWAVYNATQSAGVILDGTSTSKNVVKDGYIENCVGFGIYVRGANQNEISFNRCYSNGLELIGVTYDAWGNRIIGNHAEGTGDNGISVTGYQNVVSSNTCRRNYHNGLCIYGRNNAVTGNLCVNNGQRYLVDATSWAGLRFLPQSGGQAIDNTHAGNISFDDQASPTQTWGVRHDTNSYVQWASGVVQSSNFQARNYVYYGNNVYLNTTGGTTGATPPTHTSGTVNDGGADWTFLFSGAPNLHANGNYGIARCRGNRTADYSDATGNANFRIEPGKINLPAIEGSNQAVQITVGTNVAPSNTGSNPGDLYLRQSATSAHVAGYLYGSPFGWTPIQVRLNGATASRPASLGSGFEGSQYFDTTLNKLMIAAGTAGVWVDTQGRVDPITGVAAAGSTQTDATQLSYAHTSVATASSGQGVKLPAAKPGNEMKVFNRSGVTINVYPTSGTSIGNLAADAATTIASGGVATFTALTTTVWGLS
jgi:hypothetical protein